MDVILRCHQPYGGHSALLDRVTIRKLRHDVEEGKGRDMDPEQLEWKSVVIRGVRENPVFQGAQDMKGEEKRSLDLSPAVHSQ